MNQNSFFLEFNKAKNTWIPPVIPEEEMAYSVRNDANALQSSDYLFIFQTEPYIDSIYIEYDKFREPTRIRRFTFHEGYSWDRDSELFFHTHCVKRQLCSFQGGQIDKIYEKYKDSKPEWHIHRYCAKGLTLLDHIYNCMKENTAKEMLYKAGLDNLAAHIDEIDELNLLASKPTEIYDGLTMKVLRSVNCPDGARLVSGAATRKTIKELNKKFPDIFADELNDAQCRYLLALIRGNLTVSEVGRLFRARRSDLSRLWNKSLYDAFIAREKHNIRMKEVCKVFRLMDSIYDNYLKNTRYIEDNYDLVLLEFFLILHRGEYDRLIRRSNRKRIYEWQERRKDYIIRYPQTINDFCREAIHMRSCLLSYVDAVINNDTTILFMRRADDINQPYITIEICNRVLIQAYCRFNEDCTPEEADWIREYCDRHRIDTGKFQFNTDIDQLF